MSFNVPAADQFDGQASTTRGHRSGNRETLAEYLRKFRTGSVTATGAGTEVVTFGTPFEDANFIVAFATDTLATTPEYITKLATGFSVVFAAAGSVDWIAIHD